MRGANRLHCISHSTCSLTSHVAHEVHCLLNESSTEPNSPLQDTESRCQDLCRA